MSGTQTAAVAAADREAIFRASGLHKSFGGVHAVRDITLSIPAGTVFAIIGPNGAGKSTLLNLMSGIHRPDAGRMTFNGLDVTDLPPHRRARRGLCRTFQKIRLFRQLSVLDNVVTGFHARRKIAAWENIWQGPAFHRDRVHFRDEAAALLAFVGLEQRLAARAASLSYGEQRMLEIARALATAPILLLVDEPAAGLNAAEVDRLFARIDLMRARGMTIVIVEHNMDLVMQVADRVLVMDYGQALFEGTPAEVQSHPEVIAAYLGSELT
jgi:branched-chain amino acid transport system ATP-binding protein